MTQIAEVAVLADEGINAAGIRHILSLRAELEALRAEVVALRERCVALEAHQPSAEGVGDS